MADLALFATSGKKRARAGDAGGANGTLPSDKAGPTKKAVVLSKSSGSAAAAEDEGGAAGGAGSGAAPALRDTSALTTFASLGLDSWLLKAVAGMGLRTPTEIQRQCIPAVLEGRNVIGCAQTGSGKTAAFALPILQKLMEDVYGIFAVILTPSRELAVQISEQFTAFGAGAGVRVATIVGGLDLVEQGRQLSTRPHIVVATPGRLAHHISLGSSPPDFRRLQYLVLDEADRLMEPSFAADLQVILKAMEGTVGRRQTLLMSATMAPDIGSTVGATAGAGDSSSEKKDGAAAAGGAAAASTDQNPRAAENLSLLAIARQKGSAAGKATQPLLVDVTPRNLAEAVTVSTLKQEYVFLASEVKDAYLWYLVSMLLPASAQKGASMIAANVGKPGGRKGKAGGKKLTLVTGTSALGKGKKAGKKGKKKKSYYSDDDEDEESEEEEEEEEDSDEEEEGAGGDLSWAGSCRSIIVFTATCRSCQLVTETLIEMGVPCTALHSVMQQQKRFNSLAKFKSSLVPVLVATDVASRGLDIPTVDAVINYDLPALPSDYIHRVGRTARAGRGGRAVSFVTETEVELFTTIEKEILQGKKMKAVAGLEEREGQVLSMLSKVAVANRMARMRLAERGFEESLAVHAARKKSHSSGAVQQAAAGGGRGGP